MKNKFLFILSPPASGSTLLWKILQTSPHVSALPKEGQALVKSILFTKDRWNPRKAIPWTEVKKRWLESWDPRRDVLLEKSPPHLIRARQLEQNFPESYFVVMMRNPYAFCEGVKRRWRVKTTYLNLAKLWVVFAKYQLKNIENLKNTVVFTYEELTDNPSQICQKLIDLIPELEALSPEKEFEVFEKAMGIVNLNESQIARLTDHDLFEINIILKKYPRLLEYFNYPYLEPSTAIGCAGATKFLVRVRSWNCRPGALRWQKGKI